MLELDFQTFVRGPGYFKLNSSLILDSDYQNIIKKSILEIANINKTANPNTLWELIKGTVRNETIKYATMKKKKSNANEEKYLKDIQELNKLIVNTEDINQMEALKRELDQKKTELENLIENKLNGYIIRSKAQIVEQNEKNTKYFASLEKKKSESKLI